MTCEHDLQDCTVPACAGSAGTAMKDQTGCSCARAAATPRSAVHYLCCLDGKLTCYRQTQGAAGGNMTSGKKHGAGTDGNTQDATGKAQSGKVRRVLCTSPSAGEARFVLCAA